MKIKADIHRHFPLKAILADTDAGPLVMVRVPIGDVVTDEDNHGYLGFTRTEVAQMLALFPQEDEA